MRHKSQPVRRKTGSEGQDLMSQAGERMAEQPAHGGSGAAAERLPLQGVVQLGAPHLVARQMQARKSSPVVPDLGSDSENDGASEDELSGGVERPVPAASGEEGAANVDADSMPATWFGGSDQGDAYKGASFGHDGFDSHPRYGGSDCGSEDELEQRMRNCGFTDADADELLCQGVKPWDDDAWDVMDALTDARDDYDDYDDY